MRPGHDVAALAELGQHAGDVEHVLGFEPEVELLGDRLREQLDERRRVGERGDRDAADQVRARATTSPRRSWRTSFATCGRWTFTTTRSPVCNVAACTCAIEAAASGTRSNSREHVFERAAQILLRPPPHPVEALRRHSVATELELAHELFGEQPFAGGDDLAELDVGRAEVSGGHAQAARDPGPRDVLALASLEEDPARRPPARGVPSPAANAPSRRHPARPGELGDLASTCRRERRRAPRAT